MTEQEKEDVELVEKHQKLCPAKFVVGILKMITSPAFIVFAVFTVYMWHLKSADKFDFKNLIVYGSVAVVFIFSGALTVLISKKTNLDIKANVGVGAEAKLGVTGDLNKAAVDIIDKVKK